MRIYYLTMEKLGIKFGEVGAKLVIMFVIALFCAFGIDAVK